jgi:exonuclease SbcC
MGNARRSVRTLSGGETFLVSLAMAFALSDIASRNVKIESLFIDEGFGTLDPETLDQAISILEKMQNEGDRSVGVISHVGALKERITTQVQLEKSSLGYSQIRVVQ